MISSSSFKVDSIFTLCSSSRYGLTSFNFNSRLWLSSNHFHHPQLTLVVFRLPLFPTIGFSCFLTTSIFHFRVRSSCVHSISCPERMTDFTSQASLIRFLNHQTKLIGSDFPKVASPLSIWWICTEVLITSCKTFPSINRSQFLVQSSPQRLLVLAADFYPRGAHAGRRARGLDEPSPPLLRSSNFTVWWGSQ